MAECRGISVLARGVFMAFGLVALSTSPVFADRVPSDPEPGMIAGASCRHLRDQVGDELPARFSWLGIDLVRPTGPAWADPAMLTCSQPTGLLAVGPRRLPGSRTAVARAGILTADVIGASGNATSAELLDRAVDQMRSSGPRSGQSWESFAVTGAPTASGQPCRRWEATGQDTAVPGQGKKPFQFDAHGLLCVLPGEESVLVGVDWSERYPADQRPSPEVAQEAAPWLTGLGILEPDTDWIVDDFSAAGDAFGADSNDAWTARAKRGAYELRFLEPGTKAGRTTKISPPVPSIGVELAMRTPRTGGAGEQHGPMCLAPQQGPGYLFLVAGDPSGPGSWEISELTPAFEFVEHATGTIKGKLRPGSQHVLRIECTSSTGATTVRGFVDGKEVARHVVTDGVGAFGSAGFAAKAGTQPFSLPVDNLVVSIPPVRPADPAALPGSTERLVALLGPVPGFEYDAPVLVGPWVEALASRGVFGDPHIDRWVDLPSGETVGVLVLAEPEEAQGATESDLDGLIDLAWTGIGRDFQTITIAGQPVRKFFWPKTGMWVYTWLDRGIYGELLANEPRVTEAEQFLTTFIANQHATAGESPATGP